MNTALFILRVLIGWHFCYEALTKLLYPGWSSAGYLQNSTGPLSALFQSIAANPTAVIIVDWLNILGLLAVGLGLMLAIRVREAAIGGMALLALYYVAYPPWFGPVVSGMNEGSYLIVNKNLVELAALAVILAASSRAGVASAPSLDQPVAAMFGPIPRRQVFSSITGLPFLGALVFAVMKKHGWKGLEEVHLDRRARKDNFVASATVRTFQFASRRELRGALPAGKIGKVPVSRLILGGNLMGGWAHARDLIYVSKLVKAYHHRDKIFETLALAESCSVNTILTNPALCDVINDYWRNGGKIQFISDCGGKDVLEMTRKSIDRGACACYIQGGVADRLVEEGKFDVMAQVLELVRKNGLPAGIGAHSLKTVMAAVDKGLIPDF